jgi:hypothetical protein
MVICSRHPRDAHTFRKQTIFCRKLHCPTPPIIVQRGLCLEVGVRRRAAGCRLHLRSHMPSADHLLRSELRWQLFALCSVQLHAETFHGCRDPRMHLWHIFGCWLCRLGLAARLASGLLSGLLAWRRLSCRPRRLAARPLSCSEALALGCTCGLTVGRHCAVRRAAGRGTPLAGTLPPWSVRARFRITLRSADNLHGSVGPLGRARSLGSGLHRLACAEWREYVRRPPLWQRHQRQMWKILSHDHRYRWRGAVDRPEAGSGNIVFSEIASVRRSRFSSLCPGNSVCERLQPFPQLQSPPGTVDAKWVRSKLACLSSQGLPTGML